MPSFGYPRGVSQSARICPRPEFINIGTDQLDQRILQVSSRCGRRRAFSKVAKPKLFNLFKRCFHVLGLTVGDRLAVDRAPCPS